MPKVLLSNLFLTLALLLGGVQVMVAHWVWVVVLDRSSPPAPIWIAAVVLLVLANAATYRPMREARRSVGMAGTAARLYMHFGVATLLLGIAVTAMWVLAGPSWALFAAAGFEDPERSAWLRAGAGGGLLLAVATILWGATGGQARFQQTRVRVPLAGLAPELAGLRVVQISDLHIGNQMEGERLDALVARVNALEPDVIAMTGDLFDFDPVHVPDGARRLAGLQARHGVFAVLGNHDTYVGSELVCEALATHAPRIAVLRGEIRALPVGAPLYVAGIDDPGKLWTDRDLQLEDLEALGPALPKDGPTILLVHRPDAFKQAERLGFDLVLSGHTHGGQIALPGLAARVNLARVISNYPRGLFRLGDAQLYVNRGAGVAGPAIRIAAAREITTLELHPA